MTKNNMLMGDWVKMKVVPGQVKIESISLIVDEPEMKVYRISTRSKNFEVWGATSYNSDDVFVEEVRLVPSSEALFLDEETEDTTLVEFSLGGNDRQELQAVYRSYGQWSVDVVLYPYDYSETVGQLVWIPGADEEDFSS